MTDQAPKIKNQNLWVDTAARFVRHRLALIGFIVLSAIILLCLCAPLIASHGPNAIDLINRNQAPSFGHWFGTDGVGRDIFSRILFGGQISLSVAFIAVAMSALIGITVGSVSGYFSGKTDIALMGFTDMVLTFPRLVIIIAFVAIIGPSIYNTMIVIALLSWPTIARLTRGEVLRIRNQEYILAAKSLGTKDFFIIIQHVLPNILSPILVAMTLDVATVILLEASLSFLGLGAQAPDASWGNMLQEARTLSILETQPWMWLPPGLMIAFTVLAVNFVGDGLRDSLDPQHLFKNKSN